MTYSHDSTSRLFKHAFHAVPTSSCALTDRCGGPRYSVVLQSQNFLVAAEATQVKQRYQLDEWHMISTSGLTATASGYLTIGLGFLHSLGKQAVYIVTDNNIINDACPMHLSIFVLHHHVTHMTFVILPFAVHDPYDKHKAWDDSSAAGVDAVLCAHKSKRSFRRVFTTHPGPHTAR